MGIGLAEDQAPWVQDRAWNATLRGSDCQSSDRTTELLAERRFDLRRHGALSLLRQRGLLTTLIAATLDALHCEILPILCHR